MYVLVGVGGCVCVWVWFFGLPIFIAKLLLVQSIIHTYIHTDTCYTVIDRQIAIDRDTHRFPQFSPNYTLTHSPLCVGREQHATPWLAAPLPSATGISHFFPFFLGLVILSFGNNGLEQLQLHDGIQFFFSQICVRNLSAHTSRCKQTKLV